MDGATSRGRSSGRRPGPSRTRQLILDAARTAFADRGFEAVTVRQIAATAEVDPAMISHHFGSKAALFRAVLEIPLDPAVEIAGALEGPSEQLAVRLLGRLLQVWDSPAGAGAIAAVRTALQRDDTTGLVRDLALSQILGPLSPAIAGGPDERQWRAALVASQVVGLIVVRYVLRLEPLASAVHPDVLAAVAPTVQRYLTGPL
ncbi:TetR family transcriptional regulator [uncultured Friedmanniella sp.]|uniref:TetR/AcrR family transcriptional regulator n=1 Tax=uncultured Friedmanniella sp. TaxID=335381 RepID=UPI0035C94895